MALHLQAMTSVWIQATLLVSLAAFGMAGRAFPQETEYFVQDLFRKINPSIEWDPANFLIDLSGRYALCRSARRRGAVKIEGWRMEDGASIGGLTDYTPGQLSHVGAVNEYLKNALPVWLDASPYKEQIKAAKKFGCSVQPRCKGFAIFTCLFSPAYGDTGPPTPKPDVDECARNNGGCQHLCHNIPGSYYCSCFSGYVLQPDRHSCASSDVDECRINNGGCDHICTNTPNSFYCSCRRGFYLLPDRRTCAAEDVDECAVNNGGCDHICTNTADSYYCSCRTGYILQPDRKTCLKEQTAENECARNNGGCQHNCHDTISSFYCSCRTGYVLEPDRRSCRDTNECLSNNGGCQHNCINTPGSFYCTCRQGYTLQPDQRTCTAIPTPPTLTDEQKALAFTRQEYDLAEGVTGTKWDRSHFLENLSGYETDCDMIGKSRWPFTYAKYEAKKWQYDVDGLFGVVPHLGSTSDSIIEILRSWASIPTKEVGCSVIPDCVEGGQQYVVVACIFRIPEGRSAGPPNNDVEDDLVDPHIIQSSADGNDDTLTDDVDYTSF